MEKIKKKIIIQFLFLCISGTLFLFFYFFILFLYIYWFPVFFLERFAIKRFLYGFSLLNFFSLMFFSWFFLSWIFCCRMYIQELLLPFFHWTFLSKFVLDFFIEFFNLINRNWFFYWPFCNIDFSWSFFQPTQFNITTITTWINLYSMTSSDVMRPSETNSLLGKPIDSGDILGFTGRGINLVTGILRIFAEILYQQIILKTLQE